MAQARLTALAAVLVALLLAVSQQVTRMAGIALLIGWAAAAFLLFGLVMGYRGAVSVAAVAFVLRIAVLGALDVALTPPLWAQTLCVVLMVELASVSITLRTRPGDPYRLVLRGVAVALGAAAIVEAMSLLLQGAVAGGTLVRVAGVVAAALAAGWVARVWSRSGLRG